jgi:hypothetical protein
MKQFIQLFYHCKIKVQLKEIMIAYLYMTYSDMNFLAPLKIWGASHHPLFSFGFGIWFLSSL